MAIVPVNAFQIIIRFKVYEMLHSIGNRIVVIICILKCVLLYIALPYVVLIKNCKALVKKKRKSIHSFILTHINKTKLRFIYLYPLNLFHFI